MVYWLNQKQKTSLIKSTFNFSRELKMNLKQIAKEVNATVVYKKLDWEQISINAIFASDLMSDVLMSDQDQMLIITSLATEQSIRSAGIVGAEAVLIANNKTVSEGMVALAKELEIVLLLTPLPKYETCVKIGAIQT